MSGPLEHLEHHIKQILGFVEAIYRKQEVFIMDLATIKAELDALKAAADNTVTAMADLKTRLDAAIAAGGDSAALQAISDEITGITAELTPGA